MIPLFGPIPDVARNLDHIDLLAGTGIGELIAEKQRAIRSETVAAERTAREDELGRAVERVLEDQLLAEHQRVWPDEIKLGLYTTAVKKFCEWTRERGVGCLPAQGTTVAAYLYDTIVLDNAGLDELKQTAKAIEFAHDQAKHYLDRAPIAAAIEFSRLALIEADKLDAEQKPKGSENG